MLGLARATNFFGCSRSHPRFGANVPASIGVEYLVLSIPGVVKR